MKFRIICLCLFLSVFYIIFIVRGASLQFFPDSRLIVAKKRNFQTIITLKPRRGIIFDRQGKELAITVASRSLFVDPFLIKNSKKVAKKLSRLLNISYSTIYKKIKNKNRRFRWIKRHISDKKMKIIKSWHLKGLAFLSEPKRIYPNGSLLAQTIGFVGRDGYGLEGLELHYDKILSGEKKKILVRKDAKGRLLFSNINTNLIALKSNGADIYLTIDSDLQFFFEKELKNVVKKYSAESALGIIMDPNTGAILAMAHAPEFNLNKAFKSDIKFVRNRCVTDAFEPGSTLKTFIIATALKKGISPATIYDGLGGKLSIDGHIIKEADDTHQFKKMTLREILSYSSNIGSSQVALDIGDKFLYKNLKNFGFGSKFNFFSSGESAGILHKIPWKKLQLATIGFGHSISVTPLQMVTAYSAIANGGFLKKPYLLKSINYKNIMKQKIFESQNIKRVLSEEQAKTITVMLISAVLKGGTGQKAQVNGFLTAGKTGTAQIVDSKKGGYIKGQYISSFAGFIPAHKPRFVIYIAVDKPKKKFYGSTVAAPVFSKVAEYAVRKYGLTPVLISEKNILHDTKKINTKKTSVKNKEIKREISAQQTSTPDFKNLSLRQAYQKASKNNIQLKIKGFGLVVRTVPKFLDPLPKNRMVKLIMSHKK